MKNIIEDIKEYPLILSLTKYVLFLLFITLLVSVLRRLIKKNIPDNSVKYKSQKGVELIGYFIAGVFTIAYFTGNVKDFGLAIGLLTAGITITLQELILSIAGSLYIFLVKVYKPGDRIEINGIKGDVIDVDSVYTTIMEIGEWVKSDNYSGRIVKLSNNFVFKVPVYNYSRDFPFIWDEIDVPIRYGSDVDLAKQIIKEVAVEVLSDFVNDSREEWKKVVEKYYIEDANLEPSLAVKLTDNWIEFNLRYITDFKMRRTTRNLLFEGIGKRLEESGLKVEIASATIEIVKIPKNN